MFRLNGTVIDNCRWTVFKSYLAQKTAVTLFKPRHIYQKKKSLLKPQARKTKRTKLLSMISFGVTRDYYSPRNVLYMWRVQLLYFNTFPSQGRSKTPFREVRPGVLCAVHNAEDDTWYRGVIKASLSPQQVS